MPRLDFSPVYYDIYGGVASSTLQESLPGAMLRAPFISGPSTLLHGPGLEVDLLVCGGGNDGESPKEREVSLCNNLTYITYQSWTNTSRGLFIASDQYNLGESSRLNYPGIRTFDLAYINTGNGGYAVWINGTHVSPIGHEVFDDSNAVPRVSFPFARLASINLPGKLCYLYHQINGTTLAEEQYDFSLQLWLTTYITVPILNTSVEGFQ